MIQKLINFFKLPLYKPLEFGRVDDYGMFRLAIAHYRCLGTDKVITEKHYFEIPHNKRMCGYRLTDRYFRARESEPEFIEII